MTGTFHEKLRLLDTPLHTCPKVHQPSFLAEGIPQQTMIIKSHSLLFVRESAANCPGGIFCIRSTTS